MASKNQRGLHERNHSNMVITVLFSPDRRLLESGCIKGMAWIWDVKTGEVIQTFSPCVASYFQEAVIPSEQIKEP